MSALAIYLERAGLTTIVIGLIKEHLQKTRPPRSLWVPFELGRPLGGWHEQGEFQLAVLRDALSLLELDQTAAGETRDYQMEDPTEQPDSGWKPPVASKDSVEQEVTELKPLWGQRIESAGGTSTGVSGLAISDAIGILKKLDENPQDFNPFTQRQGGFYQVKLMVDDIKTYYVEAALHSGKPNSEQIGQWFWHDTAAGALLQRLRSSNLESDDKVRQFICSRLLVPGKWL